MQRIIRVGILVLIIGFLGFLVIYNTLNPAPPDMTTWNAAMAKGDPETAKHHFVMYTDIFCPYCDKFSDAVAANLEDFNKHYIEDEKVLFEIRVTDVNYENGHSNNSKPAGVAAYCAAREGNFWDYYYALLKQIFEDYHSHGVGVDRTSPKIPDLDNSYFYHVAKDVEGLDYEKMKTCINNEETLSELQENTKKANAQLKGNGVPYFVFNKYVTPGFRGNWNTDNDYQEVKLMMDAGLTSK